jgi:hypothetical protein
MLAEFLVCRECQSRILGFDSPGSRGGRIRCLEHEYRCEWVAPQSESIDLEAEGASRYQPKIVMKFLSLRIVPSQIEGLH